MQGFNIDIWGMFIALITMLGTCSTSGIETNNIELTMPSTQAEAKSAYQSVDSKLTLILLNDESIFVYEGNDLNKGRLVGKADIRNQIREAKKKFSASNFVVLFKPGNQANYKTTVDMLDEMTINKVETYAMETITDEEKQFLNIKY